MWLDALLSEPPLERHGNNLVYGGEGSADWQKLQDGAEKRYLLEDYNSPTDLEVSALFGGFIAVDLPSKAVVLDVGCGPFDELQPYVTDLELERYLGLEPILATPKRSYPCLVGVLAERIPLKDQSIDAAIFATSLDHIEDEDAAMRELRRVLKPTGRILIWQDLYEPRMVAREKTFERVFFGTSRLKAAARIAAGPLEYATVGWRILDRARKLRRGARIDNLHARYYTIEMMHRSAQRWGMTIRRQITVPGSTAMFVDLRLG
jgi:SAM-dependent methyltransferase